MDISYKWLKRFIDFQLSARELAAVFTSIGLECDTVEEVESIKGGLRGIVIGKVLTCEEHPNSDHLHITTVDLGTGEPVQIVCGAPNVAAGQTVVVATVGTTLYDGDKEFQIKKSKIRGVESFGMICAEDEIGVGTSHDGIIVIKEDVKPGTPAAEYYHLESDYRLEVELTPNRVDAASHYGCARDLKAYLAARNPESPMPVVTTPSVSEYHTDRPDGAVKVEVIDYEGAPRYSGVTIRGVKVTESPEWLKNLLIAAGQRPINCIVDITNFILLGLGQPLHCFDADKIEGETVVVRTCPAGTKFTTLDGKEHELHESDLMICDSEKPMCIAGVFGGLDSGVTENTTNIFIESAYFNATRVRRTARRHGLSTDASFRYERGTDPNITIYAAQLAALMVKELAGGEICGEMVDIYPNPIADATTELSYEYCNKLIGQEIPKEMIQRILEALEIKINEVKEDSLCVAIPPYRVDVTRPCDLVEEILRIYGYNNIGFPEESHVFLSQKQDTDLSAELQNTVSDQLSAQGFREILNNSLTAVSYYTDCEEMPLERCVKLMNPLSSDLGVLRQSLLFGGLEVIAHNANRKATDLNLYEFGNVYTYNPEKESTKEAPLVPFSEETQLGIWITGNSRVASWNQKAEPADPFMLKAVVLNILSKLGVNEQELTATQGSDGLFAVKLTYTTRGGQKVAELGQLKKSVLKRFDIEQDVMYAQIAWKHLFKMAKKHNVTFTDVPKTQAVERDLSLLIDKSVTFDEIKAVVAKTEKKLLRGVRLFDVYEGKNLPEGKKSYAISITLQDMEKTLQDKQIDAVMQKIIKNLQTQLGAELR